MSTTLEKSDFLQDLKKLFDYALKHKIPEFHVRNTPNGEDVLVSLDEVMEHPYMVFNNRKGNFWIVIRLPSGVDPLDHCQTQRIPRPTAFIMAADQSSTWGLWKLKNPVPKENVLGSKYFNDLRRKMRKRAKTYSLEETCDDDIGPNPFHENWDVTMGDDSYTLDDIKREMLGERRMNEVIHLEFLKAISEGVNEMMEAAFRDPDVPYDKLDIIGTNEGRAVMSSMNMPTNVYMAHVRKAVQEQLEFLGGMDREEYIAQFSEKQRKRGQKKGQRVRLHLKDRALADYAKTQSLRETASRFGVSKDTISRWVRDA